MEISGQLYTTAALLPVKSLQYQLNKTLRGPQS